MERVEALTYSYRKLKAEDKSMSKKIVKRIAGLLFILNVLFSQHETVGFELVQQGRHIDLLKTNTNVWSVNYRSEYPSGMRYTVSLGLTNIKLSDINETLNPNLKSSNQIYAQLRGMQKIDVMYVKGAVQFYSIKGNAYEATGVNSEIKNHNIYQIFEFPLGAGFILSTNEMELSLGIIKTYFLGNNEKEIVVYNSGNATSLGYTPKRSFKSDLGVGVEATAIYHFSKKVDIELDFIKYKDKDFSLKFSIWGPLERML